MTQRLPRSRPPSWPTILVLLLLSGCHAATSEPTTSCGRLFTYSSEFQKAAKAEYDKLKGYNLAPNVLTMIDDYGVTRDTIRACGR